MEAGVVVVAAVTVGSVIPYLYRFRPVMLLGREYKDWYDDLLVAFLLALALVMLVQIVHPPPHRHRKQGVVVAVAAGRLSSFTLVCWQQHQRDMYQA